MSPALTPLEQDCVATVAMALLVYESPQRRDRADPPDDGRRLAGLAYRMMSILRN